LGKVVRLDKILIKNNPIIKSHNNGLTTGVYITAGKKKNVAPR